MKKFIRNKYKLIRKNIKDKEKKDLSIYNNLIQSKICDDYDTVLVYVSTLEEVDTIHLIKYFILRKKIAVPKIENGTMNFYYINDLSELKMGYFNILEPITNNKVIDFSNSICITPGICFSKDGFRIGYGGGYYDRFFSKHKLYSVGLCYKECLVNKIEVDKYDKKVDVIITD